jgi:hypothetical protein
MASPSVLPPPCDRVGPSADAGRKTYGAISVVCISSDAFFPVSRDLDCIFAVSDAGAAYDDGI